MANGAQHIFYCHHSVLLSLSHHLNAGVFIPKPKLLLVFPVAWQHHSIHFNFPLASYPFVCEDSCHEGLIITTAHQVPTARPAYFLFCWGGDWYLTKSEAFNAAKIALVNAALMSCPSHTTFSTGSSTKMKGNVFSGLSVFWRSSKMFCLSSQQPSSVDARRLHRTALSQVFSLQGIGTLSREWFTMPSDGGVSWSFCRHFGFLLEG